MSCFVKRVIPCILILILLFGLSWFAFASEGVIDFSLSDSRNIGEEELEAVGLNKNERAVKVYCGKIDSASYLQGFSDKINIKESLRLYTESSHLYFVYKENSKYQSKSVYSDGRVIDCVDVEWLMEEYLYDIAVSPKKLFLSVDATNKYLDIKISEVYCFFQPEYIYAYLITNHGNYVYSRVVSSYKATDNHGYLVPEERFIELFSGIAAVVIESGYPREIPTTNPKPIAIIDLSERYDMSEYEVKPFENLYLPMIVIGVLIVGMAVTITVLVIKTKKKKQSLPVDDEQSPDEI